MNTLQGKSIFAGVLSLLALASMPAFGKNATEDFPLALALQKKQGVHYKVLSDDCIAGDMQIAPRVIEIVLTGLRDCGGKQWLTGFYKGERVYAEHDGVIYKPEKLAALQAYPAEQVEQEAKVVSLYFERDYLDKMLKEMNRKAALGVGVFSWGITDESEYTSGTGFRFKVGNSARKPSSISGWTCRA